MASWQPVDGSDPFADIEIFESASASDDDIPTHFECIREAPRNEVGGEGDEEDEPREGTWDVPQMFLSQPLQQQADSPVLGHATLYSVEVEEDANGHYPLSAARRPKRQNKETAPQVSGEIASKPKSERIKLTKSPKKKERRVTEVAHQDQSDAEEAAHTPHRTSGVRSNRMADDNPENDDDPPADDPDSTSHRATGKKKRKKRKKSKSLVKPEEEPEVDVGVKVASDVETDVHPESRGFSLAHAPPAFSSESQLQSNQEFFDAVEMQEEAVAVTVPSPQGPPKRKKKKRRSSHDTSVDSQLLKLDADLEPVTMKRKNKKKAKKHRNVEEEKGGGGGGEEGGEGGEGGGGEEEGESSTIEDPNSILFGVEDPLHEQRKDPKKHQEVEEQVPSGIEDPESNLFGTDEPSSTKKNEMDKSQLRKEMDLATIDATEVDTSGPTADFETMALDLPESLPKEKRKKKRRQKTSRSAAKGEGNPDDQFPEEILDAYAHDGQDIHDDEQVSATERTEKNRAQEGADPASDPDPDRMDVDEDGLQPDDHDKSPPQPADDLVDIDNVATQPLGKRKRKNTAFLTALDEDMPIGRVEDSVPESGLLDLATENAPHPDTSAGDAAEPSTQNKKRRKRKRKSRAQTRDDVIDSENTMPAEYPPVNDGMKSIEQVLQRSDGDEPEAAEGTARLDDAGPELFSKVEDSAPRKPWNEEPTQDKADRVASSQDSSRSAELGSAVKKARHDTPEPPTAKAADDMAVDETIHIINDILDQGGRKPKRKRPRRTTKSDQLEGTEDEPEERLLNKTGANPTGETALPPATSDLQTILETQEPVETAPVKKSKRKRGDLAGEGEGPKAKKKQRQRVSHDAHGGDSVFGLLDVYDTPEQHEEPVTDSRGVSGQDVDMMMELGADIDDDPFDGPTPTAQRHDPELQVSQDDAEMEQDELTVRKLNFNPINKALSLVSSQLTTIPSSPAIQDETPTRPKRLWKKVKPSHADAPSEDEESAGQQTKATKPPRVSASSARTDSGRRRSLSATPASEKHTIAASTHRWMKLKRQVYDGDVTSADFEEEKPASGEFTDWEQARLFETVKTFQERWSLDEAQVVDTIQGPVSSHPNEGDLAGKLWSRLQQQLPHRKLVKIRDVTRKRYHNYVARGQWTDEQDEELRRLHKRHAGKWSALAQLINRHPVDVRDRWRNKLAVGPGVVSAEPWIEEEELALVRAVMDSMEVINETRRKSSADGFWQQDYYQLINWASIAEKMNPPRGRSQVMGKWNRLNLVFTGKEDLWCQAPDSQFSWALEKARRQLAHMPLQVKERIVRGIHQQAPENDRTIRWGDILKDADDRYLKVIWHRSTIELFWQRARRSVKGMLRPKDCADVLLQRLARHGSFQEYGDADMSIAVERKIVADVPIVKAAMRRSTASAEQGNIASSQLQILERGDDRSVAESGRISRDTQSPTAVPISTPLGVQAETSTPTPADSLVKMKPTPGRRRLLAQAKAAGPASPQALQTMPVTSRMKRQPPKSVQAVQSSPRQGAQGMETPRPAKLTRASDSSSRKSTQHDDDQREAGVEDADEGNPVHTTTRPLRKSKAREKTHDALSAELVLDSNSDADGRENDEPVVPNKASDKPKDSTATESTSDPRSTRSALDLHVSGTSNRAVSTTDFLRRAANTPQTAKARGRKGLLVNTPKSTDKSAQKTTGQLPKPPQRGQDEGVIPQREEDAAKMPPPTASLQREGATKARHGIPPNPDPDAVPLSGLGMFDQVPDNHTEVWHAETGDGSMHFIDGVAVYDGLPNVGIDDGMPCPFPPPIPNTRATDMVASAPHESSQAHPSSMTKKTRGQDKVPSTPPWLFSRGKKSKTNPGTEAPNPTPPSAQPTSSQTGLEVKTTSNTQTTGPWDSGQERRSGEDASNLADASDAELSALKHMLKAEPESDANEFSDDEYHSPVDEPWEDNQDSGSEEADVSHDQRTTRTPFRKLVRRRSMEDIEVTQEDGDEMDVDGEGNVGGNVGGESDDDSVGDIPAR